MLERLQKTLKAASPPTPEGSIRLCFSADLAELQINESLIDPQSRIDAALLDAKRSGKALIKLGRPTDKPVD